ncbi:MAG TPA: zinc ribbon domain-containing protein [Acidimicrobiales bacterium]|nr:zinc ribbon domain-containing protein [Acidimicrobiales bacterium]
MTDYPARPRSQPTSPVDGVGVFCASCQAPLPPDADFCNKCGAPRLTRDTSATQVLPVNRPQARETVYEEEIRDERPMVRTPPPTNWWPLAALGVLGVLILFLVLFLALDDDDDDVVDPNTTTTTLLPVTSLPPVAPAPPPAPVTQPPQTVFVPVQPAPTNAPASTSAPTTTATTSAPTTAATTATTTAPVSGL